MAGYGAAFRTNPHARYVTPLVAGHALPTPLVCVTHKQPLGLRGAGLYGSLDNFDAVGHAPDAVQWAAGPAAHW
jgi:hypothetical protein